MSSQNKNKGNNKMNDILDRINLILNEQDDNKVDEKQDEYEIFFNKMLKKFKVKSPDQLDKKEKKKFFDAIEKG